MSNPVAVFRRSPCSASVFANPVERGDGQFTAYRVTFQCRYRDKDGDWKTKSSLGVNDIPKAVLALQDAYDYLTSPRNNISDQQKHAIRKLLEQLEIDGDQVEQMIKVEHGVALDDLTNEQAGNIIRKLQGEMNNQE